VEKLNECIALCQNANFSKGKSSQDNDKKSGDIWSRNRDSDEDRRNVAGVNRHETRSGLAVE